VLQMISSAEGTIINKTDKILFLKEFPFEWGK
jgi:hypothetical protein